MNAERLLKLAEHLESGRLGHKQFDFTVYTSGKRRGNGCGTAGCALGECPVVWPDAWTFRDGTIVSAVPLLRESDDTDTSAVTWFGISIAECLGLFYPYKNVPWGNRLSGDATASQVARSIRQFVAWKQVQAAVAAEAQSEVLA